MNTTKFSTLTLIRNAVLTMVAVFISCFIATANTTTIAAFAVDSVPTANITSAQLMSTTAPAGYSNIYEMARKEVIFGDKTISEVVKAEYDLRHIDYSTEPVSDELTHKLRFWYSACDLSKTVKEHHCRDNHAFLQFCTDTGEVVFSAEFSSGFEYQIPDNVNIVVRHSDVDGVKYVVYEDSNLYGESGKYHFVKLVDYDAVKRIRIDASGMNVNEANSNILCNVFADCCIRRQRVEITDDGILHIVLDAIEYEYRIVFDKISALSSMTSDAAIVRYVDISDCPTTFVIWTDGNGYYISRYKVNSTRVY